MNNEPYQEQLAKYELAKKRLEAKREKGCEEERAGAFCAAIMIAGVIAIIVALIKLWGGK